MLNIRRLTQKKQTQLKSWTQLTLTTLGLTSVLTGCNPSALMVAKAQDLPTATPTQTPLPTVMPTQTAMPIATNTPWPTATPLPTATPWPTPTPWPQPLAWRPTDLTALPTLAAIPVIPANAPVMAAPTQNGAVATTNLGGPAAVIYNPPNGVDVAGNVVLRWEFQGQLAEDEYFDIRIKPEGSNNSAFVDWTKSPEYVLSPWSGWQAGSYTWQIGIVKGYKEGETKNFIGDTGRDSATFLLKWHTISGGGRSNGGGGSTGGGGGGGSSGGS